MFIEKLIAVFLNALAGLALIFAFCGSGAASANYIDWETVTHAVFEGDINGDGIADIYLKPKHTYIPIAVDIMFFLELKAQAFVLIGREDGGFDLDDAPNQSLLLLTLWTPSSYSKHVEDFNGDGLLDYLLQPKMAGRYSIILVSPGLHGSAYISQQLGFDGFGYEMASDAINLTILDINGDGLADMLLRSKSDPSASVNLLSVGGEFPERGPIFHYGSHSNPSIPPYMSNEITLDQYKTNINVSPVGMTPQDYSINLSDAEITVGEVSAEFSVTPSGIVNYRIPLEVPATPNSLTPNLGLIYRSATPEGMLGKGWSLDGQLTVHRCPANMYENGINAPISYQINPIIFCFSGQQLVFMGVYSDPDTGVSGFEYRTKADVFSRVVSVGASRFHPSYWKVWMKDGRVLEFGYSEDSKVNAISATSDINSANIVTWALNSETDRFGKTISYNYNKSEAGEFYLISLQYGVSHSQSSQPVGEMIFDYVDGSTVREYFSPVANHNGFKRTTSKVLKRVRVMVGGALVSTYEIGYVQGVINRTLALTHISKCNYEVSGRRICLQPTEFSYTGISEQVVLNQAERAISGRATSAFFSRDYFVDVDKDGRADLVSINANQNEFAVARIYMANQDGHLQFVGSHTLSTRISDLKRVSFTISDIDLDGVVNLNELDLHGNSIRLASWRIEESGISKIVDSTVSATHFGFRAGWVLSQVNPDSKSFTLVDFNDGQQSYRRWFQPITLSGTYAKDYQCEYYHQHLKNQATIVVEEGSVSIKNKKTVVASAQTVPPGENYSVHNGGQRIYLHGRNCVMWSEASYTSPYPGYGVVDLNYYTRAQSEVQRAYPIAEFKYDGFNNAFYSSGVYFSDHHEKYFSKVDVNGDGLNDMAVVYRDGVNASLNVHLNTAALGASTAEKLPVVSTIQNIGPWVSGESPRAYRIMQFDYNSDELEDVVLFRYAGNDLYMDVYPATSTGIDAASKVSRLIKAGLSSDEHITFHGADLVGTGAPQVVGLSNRSSNLIHLQRLDWQPFRASQITQGMGDITHITYSPLTSDSHSYESVVGNPSLYVPLSGIYVVSSVARSSSTSLDRPINYPYQTVTTEPVCYEATSHQVPSHSYDPFVIPGYCRDGYWLEPYEVTAEVCVANVCVEDTFVTESVFVPATCYEPVSVSGRTVPAFSVETEAYCVAVEPSAEAGYLDAPFDSGNELVGSEFKQRTIYRYSGLRVHKDGLGSLGFREVSRTNAATGQRIVTTYSQDYANRLTGRVLSVNEFVPASNGMRLLHELNNSWKTLNLSEGRYVTVLEQTTDQSWELDGTLMSDVTKSFVYDFDNDPNTGVGEVVTETVVSRDGNALKRMVTNSWYGQNEPDSWIFPGPTRIQIVRNQSATDVDGQSERNWSRTYSADTGVLLSEIAEPIEYSVSTTPAWYKKEYVYSTAGLLDSSTISGVDIPTKTVKFEYDAVFGWLRKKTDAFGNSHFQRSVSYEPHPVHGKPMSSENGNGLVTRFDYDALGREIARYRPDGSLQITNYVRYLQGYSAYYIEKRESDGGGSREYFDRKERLIHKRVTGKDGRTTYSDVIYDVEGRVVKESLPYLGGTPVYWKQILHFDAMNRPVQSLEANGALERMEYQGRTVRHVNANQQQKVKTVDGFGRVVAMEEYNLGVPLTIRYVYDANDNLVETIDATASPNIVIKQYYNLLNQRTAIQDPNKGYWRYEYDVAGNLVLQTDAKGVSTCLAYDLLGRKTLQVDGYRGDIVAAKQRCAGATGDSATELAEWYYDSAPGAALGLVHRVFGGYDHVSQQYLFQQEFAYDSLSRVVQDTKLIDGVYYTTGTTYYNVTTSLAGKVKGVVYPSGFSVEYKYNGVGALAQIINADTQALYWELLSSNAFGAVAAERFGNGAKTINDFNPMDGNISRIYSTHGLSTNYLFDHYYDFDHMGNLSERRDGLGRSSESFTYDDVDRLKTTSLSVAVGDQFASHTFEYDYSDNGNLRSRPEVAPTIMEYGSPSSVCAIQFAGPHAVTQVGSRAYCYDQNGNVTRRGSDAIHYNLAGKPVYLASGTNSSRFEYDPSNVRYRRVDSVNGAQTTTVYVGNYERVVASDYVKETHTIGGIAVVTIENGFAKSTRYLHKDHLGSVIGTTDHLGNVVDRYSYDPWGRRRASSWEPLNASMLSSLVNSVHAASATSQGYTGQEMLDHVGLVHMNGRVYDPTIGRMLSADPFVPDMFKLQAYNRYSYVLNNPMKLVDPSGFSYEDYDWNIGFTYSAGDDWSLDGLSFGVTNAGGSQINYAEMCGACMDYYSFGSSAGMSMFKVSPFNETGDSSWDFYHHINSANSSEFAINLSHDVYQYASAYFDIWGGSAQKGGSPITDAELALAKEGKFLEFWRSRYAGVDPVAKTALTGWDPDFKGANFIERMAARHTWSDLEGYISSNELTVSMEQIGAELALAHAYAVRGDANSLLSPNQVAGYHHQVFGKHDIPAGLFGGTHHSIPFVPSSKPLPANLYSGMWCSGCDTSP